MEIKTVGKSDSSLRMELDADMGFVNLLRKQVWRSKNTTFSAYKKDHPYMGKPQLLVKVSSGSASKVLKDACSEISSMASDYQKEFSKVFKK